jgi:uncharacterized protein YbaR (Trm112 family)
MDASKNRFACSVPPKEIKSMVSEDLLGILRCPYCVSGETRKPGEDPGRLELVYDCWLVCQEPDCERKYPIRDDIPVMLIEEGENWLDTPADDLPVPPPAE